jgi:hypothetical protein
MSILGGWNVAGILQHINHNNDPNFYHREYDNNTPGRGDSAYRY